MGTKERKSSPLVSEKTQSEVAEKPMSYEEFVYLAIERLASTGWKTIHTVFSGFNASFRQYYASFGDTADPVDVVKDLHKAGKIDFRICRGGALIGKLGSIPSSRGDEGNALNKMGLRVAQKGSKRDV